MKKLLLFVCVIGLVNSNSMAQPKVPIDSLERAFNKLSIDKKELRKNQSSLSDTSIINLLFEFWKYYKSQDPNKAKEYTDQALALSEKIKYKKGIGESYYNLAIYYYIKREFSKSLDFNNKALKLKIELRDKKGIAATYNNLGNVYYAKGEFPIALENYLTSLKIKDEIKDKQGIADANANIGNVYVALSKFNDALKYYASCLKINEELGDKEALENIYINIGTLYLRQGNFKEAAKSYESCIKIAQELNDKIILSDCYNNLGAVYFYMGNINEEMNSYISALKIKEELGDKSGIATIYINIGDVYTRQSKFKDARKYLDKALEMAKESKSQVTIYQSYRFLTDLDSFTGDFNQAFKHYKLMIASRDSMLNNEELNKINALQMQYEFDKKEAAIKSKQAIKDAIAKEKIQQQKIIILSVILGSGLLLFGLLYFINRRRAKHALEVNKLENKTLRSQLNPHFIFNALASIQKYMNEHPEKAENYLAKFGKLMREVLENSEKEYISLEDEFEMLKNYLDLEKLRVKNGFNYQFNIHENIDAEEIKLPPLLLQPIVENAIWHGVANDAGKGEIIINVERDGDFIKFKIENKSENQLKNADKNNTVLEVKRKSFGQQIVRERLNLLSKDKNKKCTLEISSTHNGMIVTVIIPI
jgi:tetratricopeptide (TPR) repeat protein